MTYDLSVSASPLMARLLGLTEIQREALRGALAGETEAEISQNLKLSALETLRELRAVYAAFGVTRRCQLLVRLLPIMLELYEWADPGY